METLEIAIQYAGGVGRLAEKLGIKANVISNWRLRNSVPRAWELVLTDRFVRKAKRRQQAEVAHG